MDRHVDLGGDIESFMDEMVETGRYASHDDVLREGVKLVRQREQKLAELFAAIEEGIADCEAGRVHDIEDVARELKARYSSDPSDRTA
jgi:antitoxin ParD1/3/4